MGAAPLSPTSSSPSWMAVALCDRMCLRQSVRGGGILKISMLKAPFAIKRGDRVKLVVKSGSLRVVTLGVAKNNAPLNGQIQVQNIRSKKLVTGRVVSSSTVEVLL